MWWKRGRTRYESVQKILTCYSNPLCPNPGFKFQRTKLIDWRYPLLALSTYWMRTAEKKLDKQFEKELDRLCRPELHLDLEGAQLQGEKSIRVGLGLASRITHRLMKATAWQRLLGTEFYKRLDEEVRNQRSEINTGQVKSKIVEFIGIYNKSIENIVEGQREVTFNPEFKLDDGETVKEKLDKFETTAKRLMKNLRFK